MANAINSLNFSNNTYTFTLPYGVCSTAAGTAAKTVTVDNFSLETGARVIVKFTNSNSATSPTLNVSGTGAKAIMRYGTTASSTGTTTSGWIAGAVQAFTYDGTNWIQDYWNNTTYSNAGLGQGYGTCSTAEATTAKAVTLSSYDLATGGIVSVKFTYAVPAGSTMNINGKGAKNIYYRGKAIIDGIIEAGDVAMFIYDGTQYHLLTVDRHRFFTMLVPYGESINSTEENPVDLNTPEYLKVGNYYCSSNAKATTLENCPSSIAFMMQVYSPLSTEIDNETSKAYIYRVRKLLGYQGAEYIQYCSVGKTAGTWTYGTWKQIVSTPTAGTAVGSTKKPIYINSNGVPTACSYSIGAVASESVVPVAKGGTGYTTIEDTTYTTARYRASSLHSSETTPSTNGVIAWTYE